MNNILIGESDFKEIRKKKGYYVDKSLFVREIIKCPHKVILLPRPRRFGKTINISMLYHFFEKKGQDKSNLFDDLAINKTEEFKEHFSKYPVIFITFKDIKNQTFEASLTKIARLIHKVLQQHSYLLNWEKLSLVASHLFKKILNQTAEIGDYEDSIQIISEQLEIYHNRQVVILIDEYDTPIHAGYTNNYYDDMISFMRNLLSGAFKDNSSLFKGVITGTLRISKESIFTGLNNIGVYTLLEENFNKCFGFTRDEVKIILSDFDLSNYYDDILKWYDGYNFGDNTILNPWSVMNFIFDRKKQFKPHWLNTSSMEMIEEVVLGKPEEQKRILRNELTDLIQDGYIKKNIDENIIMQDLYKKNNDVIWSFLLHSGYLKQIERIDNEFENIYKLQIPNMEVKIAYRKLIQKWFEETVNLEALQSMLQSLKEGNISLFEKHLKEISLVIMSYHDFSNTPEKVYHALVLGMLVWLSNDYDIRSNRESGYGRFDILFKPKNLNNQGIIIEFKRIDNDEDSEKILNSALEQIHKKKYDVELKTAGVNHLLKIAVGFKGKEVHVKKAHD